MSLVNNMLRDLDQRRKESDGGGSTVKLMPASDMPVERRNRALLYLMGTLLVAAAGLTWLWLDTRADSESTRPLNIRPAVVDSGSSQAVPAVAPNNLQTAQSNDQPVTPDASPSSSTAARDVESRSAVQREVAASSSSSPQTPVQPPEQDQSPATRIEAEQGDATPPLTDVLARQLAQPAPVPAESGTIDVRNQPPAESVKNRATMSAEQRDTLAVQEALRLIQNGESVAAYAHLEQHIINNRYAHQSRETYAKLLMNDGETLAAYNLLESGLALAPNHAGYKKVKARILISTGRMEEAVDLLSRRAPEVSVDLEYHELLATAQLASRDYEGALITYTGLVQQNRSQGKWWYGFAASQDSLGNNRAAYQAYNQAIQQANLSPNLRRRSQERLSALSQ